MLGPTIIAAFICLASASVLSTGTELDGFLEKRQSAPYPANTIDMPVRVIRSLSLFLADRNVRLIISPTRLAMHLMRKALSNRGISSTLPTTNQVDRFISILVVKPLARIDSPI